MNIAIYLKIVKICFLILFLFLFNSCGEDIKAPQLSEPILEKVNSDTLIIGDTLIIYGDDFGSKTSKSHILFPNNVIIPSNNCLQWNNVKISVLITADIQSGFFKIVRDSLMSDSLYITINDLPDMETVLIKAGEFNMGSDASSSDESPVRNVIITKDFLMSKYEINQKLYNYVIGNEPSLIKNPLMPVYNIQWLEAIRFCNEYSKKTGLDSVYVIVGNNVAWNKNANGWRLPTEAEWEYACRAGSQSDYSNGNSLDELGRYNENSGGKPHYCGSLQPNNWGLYDMHGNVWEWCWDWYSSTYYSNGENIDPIGPIDGNRRVKRGGAYDAGALFARSSNRSIPASSQISTGLRIVRNP